MVSSPSKRIEFTHPPFGLQDRNCKDKVVPNLHFHTHNRGWVTHPVLVALR